MKRIIGIGTVALLGIGLLAGCGGPVGETTSASVDAQVGMAMPAEAPIADKAPQQQVITTAWMTVRVEAVPGATEEVVRLVQARKGSIQQQDLTNTGDSVTATITARIPAADLDAFVAEVSGLGTVESASRQASDVTQQTIDLDARISALTTSVERLTAMQEQTTNVADLVAVETELANRQAELDSLTAQRAYLADQVAMSTVTITLVPVVQAGGWQAPGFLSGIQNGWSALLALVSGLITAIGFLLPFIVIAAIIVVPITWLLVRRSRRR